MKENSTSKPSLFISLVPILALMVMLSYSIIILGLDIETGGTHIPLILGTGVAGLISVRLGNSWKKTQNDLVNGISHGLSASLILMVIGTLIGTWLQSGIVPAMIYYGLKLINPTFFLVTSCLICSLVSLSTGSSWSTAGTVGVAFIGIGTAMGIPAGMVAGSVISGAYFGDKMSPLSDTTNLAPATAGTDLFTHIKHMVYTVTPSLIISLILYMILGFYYGSGELNTENIDLLLSTIDSSFNISIFLLIMPLMVIFMVIFKIPALPALLGGAILGGLFAIGFQGSTLKEVIMVSMNGFTSSTGVAEIDSLLSRGGLMSMMNTIAIIFTALSFGGVMEGSGMLETIADAILKFAKSVGSLILTTVVTCIGMNIVAPDQYLSIVIPGRMYKNAYEKFNLHPKNLSRTLEDAGTITSPLVPWNTCGAFMGGVLGVSAFAYAPFAFLNLLNPLMAVIFGYTGYSIEKLDESKE